MSTGLICLGIGTGLALILCNGHNSIVVSTCCLNWECPGVSCREGLILTEIVMIVRNFAQGILDQYLAISNRPSLSGSSFVSRLQRC
jgi:hypothetical protein